MKILLRPLLHTKTTLEYTEMGISYKLEKVEIRTALEITEVTFTAWKEIINQLAAILNWILY